MGNVSPLALFLMLGVGIFVGVLFMINLRDLLRNVSPQNRAMGPNRVWLNFIPVFNLVWMFVTVIKIRDSARAEFRSRGWATQEDFGYGVGLAYAVTVIVSQVLSLVSEYVNESAFETVTLISGLLSLVALVCWIVYWVKTANVKNRLVHGQPTIGPASAPPPPGYGGWAPQGSRRGCSYCGAMSEPGDDFCRTCGERLDAVTGGRFGAGSVEGLTLADSVAPVEGAEAEGLEAQGVTDPVCPFCGATYRPNAQFCASCGRPAV
jgi:hypothetical protein